MGAQIAQSLSTWHSYWGESGYPFLFAAALLFLCVRMLRRMDWKTDKASSKARKVRGSAKSPKSEAKEARQTECARNGGQRLVGETEEANQTECARNGGQCQASAVKEGKSDRIGALAAYTATVLFLFFFPISAMIIKKCVGADVYWRVLWILPVIPVIAYGGTCFVQLARKKAVQVVFLVVVLAGIMFSGTSVYEGNYIRTHNHQQVPDEVAHVCNLINAHRGAGEALLVTDNNLSPYIRVYDPSISMIYGRLGRGAQTKEDKEIYKKINVEQAEYSEIAQSVKERGCNYLVICVYNEEQEREIEAEGYVLLDYVNQYGVFGLE